jgi:AAA family ATP:ADP antiporter
VAARLFGEGVEPQVIIQVSAALLLGSLALYLVVNARETRRAAVPEAALAATGGFRLVWRSEYLRLIALLIILLNVVNTTGEYLRASLLTSEAAALKAANPAFNEAAYIGAFAGNYQFWTNVLAFLLKAFVTSRLVSTGSTGRAGASARGARWLHLRRGRRWPGGQSGIKNVENATDYSIMNTARQLCGCRRLGRRVKAKQAIDTFFVRGGDSLSAATVLGTAVIPLGVFGFAAGNVVPTLVWIGVALILKRHRALVEQPAKAA